MCLTLGLALYMYLKSHWYSGKMTSVRQIRQRTKLGWGLGTDPLSFPLSNPILTRYRANGLKSNGLYSSIVPPL